MSRIKEENELKARKSGQPLNNSKLEASVVKANERKTKMNQMLNYNYRVDVAPAPPPPPAAPIEQHQQQTSQSPTPSLPETPSQPEVTKTLNKSNSSSSSSIWSSDSSPAPPPKIPSPSPQPQSQSNSKTTPISQLSRIDLQTELDEENRVEVSVSAYSGSLSFWVQLLANADTLTKFNDDMAEFYNSNVSSFYDFVSIKNCNKYYKKKE